jgi:cobalamin-dependent methionine synthase I
VLKPPLSITNVAVRRVMKAAVAQLEPHMEKSDDDSTDAFVLHHPEAKYFNT